MIDFGVIIVSYNVKDYLERAIVSVQRALEGITHEIFVVDNDSSDGSADMIAEKFPSIRLMRLPENLGFAKATNIALKQAQGKYITLINPDTVVYQDTFARLNEAFEQYPDAGIVGGKILNEDGTLQLSCRRSIPTPWIALSRMLGLSRLFPQSRFFARYNMTYLDPDIPAEVEAVSGSFMTIHRKVLDSAGYLDERFFMYGEDLDWCLRIRQAGWKIIYYPKSLIIHYKGKSSEASNSNQIKLFYTAMSCFAEKHFKNHSIFTPLWLITFAIHCAEAVALIRMRITRTIHSNRTRQ